MLPTITRLQSANTRSDLAKLLGFSPKGLTYILYKLSKEDKYTPLSIPKKNGGIREILAPTQKLKLLQKRLSILLQDCHDQITVKSNKFRHLSHGFRREHSIFTNAQRHRGKLYSFNVDLEDFFNSFNFERVRGFFIKDKNFQLNDLVATTIAQIACHEGILPQGSPVSPVITNLIFHIADIRLSSLASKHKCIYTRYADDITFSTNSHYFPEEIATPSLDRFDTWLPGKKLSQEIKKAGFTINKAKVRMHYPGSRMEVTGLTTNKRVNTKKEYRLKTRSMVHKLIREENLFINRDYNPKEPNHFKEIKKRLSGRLAHIHYIDRMHEESLEPNKKQKSPPQKDLSLRDKTYRNFLLFSHFAKAEKPLVICEGKTDSTYLKCALKQLPKSFDKLVTEDGTFSVEFFSYSATTAKILHLGGGESHLNSFIHTYINFISSTNITGLPNPIIILVDNDKGAQGIFSNARRILNSKEPVNGNHPFYRLKYNLYLVALPKEEPESDVCIEDFFDRKTLSEKINGKFFSKSNNINPKTQYGKAYFSENIIKKKQDSIDFSRFRPILDRLNSAISDYIDINSDSS